MLDANTILILWSERHEIIETAGLCLDIEQGDAREDLDLVIAMASDLSAVHDTFPSNSVAAAHLRRATAFLLLKLQVIIDSAPSHYRVTDAA
jgi:hypothetical protein